MMSLQRRRLTEAGQPAHFGGIDEYLWAGTVRALLAARTGRRDEYLAAVKELTTGLEDERLRLAGLYLFYMIKFWLGTLIGVAPTEGDVARLCNSVRVQYHLLIPANLGLLDETMRTACNMATPEERVKGGLFQIRAIAILGLLLADPDADLTVIKTHLAVYCEVEEEAIRKLCETPPKLSTAHGSPSI